MVQTRSDDLIEEIRLNGRYASLFYSEYPSKKHEGESIPTIKKKTMLASEYIDQVVSSNVEGIIMPPNCRYIEEMDSGYMVVIEEPPAYRTIKSNMSATSEISRLRQVNKLDLYGYKDWLSKNSPPYSFTLAFPYVIFILYITKYNEVSCAQIFLRTQQMTGLSDYLLKIPMCNISDSGFVCFGDAICKRCKSLTATVQHAIMVWWSATFNTDYTYNYRSYRDVPILNSYLEWQYMSQENPMFIYNADWLKIEHTIGERIKHIKKSFSLKNKKTMGYKQLTDVFCRPYDTGLEMKVSKRSKRTSKLFFDIAQGMYLDDQTNMNVGDSFKTKSGKIAFISSFVGFPDGSNIKYIQIAINDKLSMMKLTKNCYKFLIKQITKQRRVSQITLANKTIVTPGKILVVTQGDQKSYKKVDYIRKSRGMDNTDIVEVKLGNDYYLSSNLDAIEFKLDKPELNGVVLNKNEQYIIITEHGYDGGMTSGHIMKFDSIIVDNQKIVAKFRNNNSKLKGRYKTLELSNNPDRKNIYKIDKVKPISGAFRVGRRLFTLPGLNYKDDLKEIGAWGVNGILIYENYYTLSKLKGSYTKSLIKDNRFFVEGADFDTEFYIGDKVVVANWENPLDVLTVKMIKGFKYNEACGDIHFILSDKEGNISESKYIDGRYGIINTGKIRKVTNKIDELLAGTKIISEVAGISCFPKKDVNIIVAFIIDTGREPLVLCSNGCTLWYNDVIEKFKKIPLKSKQWETLNHVPLDLSKIKFQAGDIVNGTRDFKDSYGYLLYNPSTTRALRALRIQNLHSYNESYVLDQCMTKECKLDCIPAPRIIPAKIAETGILKGFLNLHSYDVFENHMPNSYLNQRRT